MALQQESIIGKHDNIIGVKRVDYFDDRFYRVSYKEGKKVVDTHLRSVTNILGSYPKHFLSRWRGEIGNERADQIMAEANRLGSFVHYAAEVLCRGGVVIYNPFDYPFYEEKEIKQLEKKYDELLIVRFQKEWLQIRRIYLLLKELKFNHVETEQQVFSLKHKFAGTLDLLMEIEEGSYYINGASPVELEYGLYLGDWKTGKGVSETYHMQMAAYLQAIIEMNPDLDQYIKGTLVFHTNSKARKSIQGLSTHYKNRAESDKYFEKFLAVKKVHDFANPIPDPTEFTMSTMYQIDLPISHHRPPITVKKVNEKIKKTRTKK